MGGEGAERDIRTDATCRRGHEVVVDADLDLVDVGAGLQNGTCIQVDVGEGDRRVERRVVVDVERLRLRLPDAEAQEVQVVEVLRLHRQRSRRDVDLTRVVARGEVRSRCGRPQEASCDDADADDTSCADTEDATTLLGLLLSVERGVVGGGG